MRIAYEQAPDRNTLHVVNNSIYSKAEMTVQQQHLVFFAEHYQGNHIKEGQMDEHAAGLRDNTHQILVSVDHWVY